MTTAEAHVVTEKAPYWSVLTDPEQKTTPQFLGQRPEPLATKEEILECLKAARRAQESDLEVDISIALDGRVQLTDVINLLPRDDESSLDSYCDRVESRASTGQFTLILFGVHKYHPGIWDRVRDSMYGIDKALPMPHQSHVDLDVFVGTYERTPTGIHRDGASNFTYVAQGTKTMLFWPHNAFTSEAAVEASGHEPLGTDRYEEHLGTVTQVSADRGEMLYWPRSNWHMSVDNARSAVLNVAFYENGQTASELARSIVLPDNLSIASDLPTVVSDDGRVQRQQWWDEVGVLAAQSIDSVSIAERLQAATLKRLSASHFLAPPAPRPKRALVDADVVGRDRGAIVPWLKQDDGTTVVGCGGRLLRLANVTLAQAAIDITHAEGPVEVGQFASSVTGSTTERERVIRLLQRLHEWHSLAIH